jgi:hypothetical protein
MIVGWGEAVAGERTGWVGGTAPACGSAAVSAGLGASVGFGALVHAINTDRDNHIISERVGAFMELSLLRKVVYR